MKSATTLAAAGALALVLSLGLSQTAAKAGEWTRIDRQAARRAAVTAWHGSHYNTQYGRPTAVVVQRQPREHWVASGVCRSMSCDMRR